MHVNHIFTICGFMYSFVGMSCWSSGSRDVRICPFKDQINGRPDGLITLMLNQCSPALRESPGPEESHSSLRVCVCVYYSNL